MTPFEVQFQILLSRQDSIGGIIGCFIGLALFGILYLAASGAWRLLQWAMNFLRIGW